MNWGGASAIAAPGVPSDLESERSRRRGSVEPRQPALFQVALRLGLLGAARRMEDLGEVFGADLTRREVDYLVENEWARTAEDILWRRTKLGLRVGLNDKARLETYLASRSSKGKK